MKRTVVDPSPKDVEGAQSIHALAFTSRDELLLSESEGGFTLQEWDDVYDAAKRICCESGAGNAGINMMLDDDFGRPHMRHLLRSTLEAQVAADLHWK